VSPLHLVFCTWHVSAYTAIIRCYYRLENCHTSCTWLFLVMHSVAWSMSIPLIRIMCLLSCFWCCLCCMLCAAAASFGPYTSSLTCKSKTVENEHSVCRALNQSQWLRRRVLPSVNRSHNIGFEVLTQVTMKSSIFWLFNNEQRRFWS
jgi:hypothetical protein